jgi:hypothetical protein
MRIGHFLTPFDVGYSRSLLSALDGVPFNPSIGFQLGLGNVGGYRYVNGMPASTAGFTGTLSGTGGFNLPLGVSMVGRFRQTTNRDWVLRLDDTQAQVQALTTTFPDFTARWSWRSASHTGLVSSIAAGAGYSRTLASATLLTDADSTAPELRSARVYSYPLNASIAWNFGGLSTAGGYTLTTRLDSMPGSFARGRTEDVNLDIGRAFRVPDSWGLGLKSPVRARFGLQQSRASTYVYGDQGGPVSRLVDNGRSAFNLNADTDLSDAVMFTFQLSRVITYDNNLNRRLNEFVLSTVLQIQMSAGPLK